MDRRKVLDETFTRVSFEYPVPPEEPEDAEAPPSEAADSGAMNTEPEAADAPASEPIDTP